MSIILLSTISVIFVIGFVSAGTSPEELRLAKSMLCTDEENEVSQCIGEMDFTGAIDEEKAKSCCPKLDGCKGEHLVKFICAEDTDETVLKNCIDCMAKDVSDEGKEEFKKMQKCFGGE